MLTVREIRSEDIGSITDYWVNADSESLLKMGVDESKLPSRLQFQTMLQLQLDSDYSKKKTYALIWEVDGTAVGHSNVNDIIFGKEAFMHLHLWQSGVRKKGLGTELVKKSLPFYFDKLRLETLYCEPFADNPAPNKILSKLGFQFVKKHTTIPGAICFEQDVNRWQITRDNLNFE